MATPHKNPNFWDILKDLTLGVPYKIMEHKYRVSLTTLSRYKEQFTETVIRIKENVVDDTQLRFSFMNDHWRNSDKEYFDPNKDSTFFKRRTRL